MKTIYKIKLPVLLSHLGLTKCVIYLRYAHTSAFYASLTSVNHLTFKSLAGILQTNCGWLQNLLILPVCWRRAGLLTVMLTTTVRLEDKPSMYKHWSPGIVPHPKSQGCNIHPSFHPSIPLSFHPSTHPLIFQYPHIGVCSGRHFHTAKGVRNCHATMCQ